VAIVKSKLIICGIDIFLDVTQCRAGHPGRFTLNLLTPYKPAEIRAAEALHIWSLFTDRKRLDRFESSIKEFDILEVFRRQTLWTTKCLNGEAFR
jgi:hypothetical protein